MLLLRHIYFRVMDTTLMLIRNNVYAHTPSTACPRPQVLCEVQDLEEVVRRGRKACACPYYASRAAVRDAQVGGVGGVFEKAEDLFEALQIQ